MNIKSIIQDRLNLFLAAFILLFFLLPFIEAKDLHFSVAPFVFFIIIFLSLCMTHLPRRLFFQSLLFLGLAFCLDLILMATVSPLLERIILIFIRLFYGGLLILSLKFLLRKMLALDEDAVTLVKLGVSGYLLVGFLWSIFYSFIFIFDKKIFSKLIIEQIPFFQYSFSTLTTLKFAKMVPVNPWAVNLSYLEVIIGHIFLAVFIGKIVSFYAARYSTRSSQ
ncbi:MAG: hypothetical protein P9M07_02375 [Candidatus Aceula meridiana]|nr:hypothetical protein [Candidatus Aceula meridiana]